MHPQTVGQGTSTPTVHCQIICKNCAADFRLSGSPHKKRALAHMATKPRPGRDGIRETSFRIALPSCFSAFHRTCNTSLKIVRSGILIYSPPHPAHWFEKAINQDSQFAMGFGEYIQAY